MQFKNCNIESITVYDNLNSIDFENCIVSYFLIEKSLKNLISKNSYINTITNKYPSNLTTTLKLEKSEITEIRFEKIILYFYVDNCKIMYFMLNDGYFNLVYAIDTIINKGVFKNSKFKLLRNINFGELSVSPLSNLLLHHWGVLSPKLTALCMAYDAQNHPDPEKFEKWAKGGGCPYAGKRIPRAILFCENRSYYDRKLISKSINPYKLLDLIFAEKNIQAEWM